MAVTQNYYTGDGTTVLYSFTFPYLNTADVKVTLDNVDTTEYTLANATQVQLNTAPASGVEIRIYRDTSSDTITADFFPGAAVKANDLNQNFDQVLYVGQEAETSAENTLTTSETALTTANNAVTTANNAVTTANNAETTANNAVATATSLGNAAQSTADDAEAIANGAVATATSLGNAAQATADSAVATANGAVTTAQEAVSTATALGNAAQSTADGAVTTANNALAAVAAAIDYDPVDNVASIPTVNTLTQTDPLYVEVKDATGIESFTPLTGIPSGFVGDSGLTVRITYDPGLGTWEWVQYFANDSEARFVKKAGDTFTGSMTFSQTSQFDLTANFDNLITTNGIEDNGGVIFNQNTQVKDLDLVGDASTYGSGYLKFNCENNSHAISLKGPPHSAAATYTLTLPNALPTLNGQALVSDLSGNTSFASIEVGFVETPQTLTVSKVIDSNINAAMIGPTVSIGSGTTITVGQNSLLTILK